MKTGFIGQNVLLPCSCSNDSKLIWQKGVRVVNVHPQDKSIIDDSYVNRTQLFINKKKSNCSLLLLNISKTDAGLYTCHVLVSDNKVWRRSSEVNLTVSTYVPTAQTVSDSWGVSRTLFPEVDQGSCALSLSHTRGFAVSEWDDDRRVTTTLTSRLIHYFHFTFLKRSDTCASSAAEFKRTNMKTLAQLTLLLIMSGSAVGQMLKYNVTGYVGMDVLLSCNCSNDPKELVWQKDGRLVNVHSQDKSIIDDSYVNRTQLFINKEKRNCSLLLLNISTADAGLYTCHALFSVENNVWSKESTEVNLTVSEMQNHEKNTGGNSVTAVSVSVPILVVMLILAVSLLLTLLIKRHHRRNEDTDLPAEKPMLQHV